LEGNYSFGEEVGVEKATSSGNFSWFKEGDCREDTETFADDCVEQW
jgi:hypothetical protein